MASKKKKSSSPDPDRAKALRARAEKAVRASRQDVADMPVEDIQALVHELQIHQVELEIQNEELRHAQVELAESRDRYAELYDFAPVGYVTTDSAGTILEANLTAGKLLGVCRKELCGSKLTSFIVESDQDAFHLHRRQFLANKEAGATCELSIRSPGGPRSIRLECIGSSSDLTHRCVLIDITGEKETERIAVQAERLRNLVENLPAGAVFVEGEQLCVNRAVEEITGYDRSSLRNRDQWFKTLYGRQQRGIRTLYEKNRRAGFLETFNTTITRSDGEERIIILSAHGFDDHEVWFLNDITERKRNETALRESEERLRAILNAASDAIITIDRKGFVMGVNSAVKQVLGYREKELVGQNIGILMPSPHREHHDEYLERYQRTGKAKIIGKGREVVARRKDGSTFPIDLSVSEVDHLGLFTGIIRDISARKAAEEALEQERDFSESIIATSKMVILVLDADGRIVRFNPYFEEVSGWRLEEAQDRNWFSTFISERDRDAADTLFKQATNGVLTNGMTNPILTKDGSERLIEWYNVPLSDRKGEAIGLLCTGVDVTERVRLEREVVEASEAERQRIARELHDGVGSLLTGLQLYLRTLRKLIESGGLNILEEFDRVISIAKEATVQSRNIARGLAPIGSDPEELMDALGSLASRTNITRQFQCRFRCPDPVKVESETAANQFYRIAQESVSNAMRHSGADWITISLSREGDRIVLKVLDDGDGFDTSDESEGIGLHTMAYRARMIGGTFSIESRKKGGTKVICSAPLA